MWNTYESFPSVTYNTIKTVIPLLVMTWERCAHDARYIIHQRGAAVRRRRQRRYRLLRPWYTSVSYRRDYCQLTSRVHHWDRREDILQRQSRARWLFCLQYASPTRGVAIDPDTPTPLIDFFAADVLRISFESWIFRTSFFPRYPLLVFKLKTSLEIDDFRVKVLHLQL